LTAAWPDLPAPGGSGKTLRRELDYLCWIAEQAEALGLHSPPDLEPWRARVQRAYDALVDPMFPGHGDPLPPDVPPSVRPGMWPDVPAAGIQGMTVRHQLTVIRTISDMARRVTAAYQSPADAARWAPRIHAARDAMDHGASLVLPDTALSAAPPAPPKSGKGGKKSGSGARKGKAVRKDKPAAKSGARPAKPRKAARRR
jgi:hypothetical protein